MTTLRRRQLIKGAAAASLGAVVAQAMVETGSPATASTAGRLGPATPLDGRPLPAYDYSRANRLPREMTGYWEKSFELPGGTRTAKVYISSDTPIRSYFTVIAVPDGVETARFLEKSSWRQVADGRDEGLFVLEPGPDGWGTVEEEEAYVAAAMAFFQANGYFSIFGLHYLVGYGTGAPPLEAWAVAHPLRVIAQVYLDSPGLRADYLDQYADREFDGDSDGTYTDVVFPEGFDLIRYDETVLPTWYIHPERDALADSLGYWRTANDATGRGVANRTLGVVYEQEAGSERWMTSHAGPVSQVAVLRRPVSYWSARTTASIVAFLTYYTRYENYFAYGNQLYERADLAALGVQVRTMMVEGFVREYLVYVPRSARRLWGRAAPVVFVWPGNSQTDKVFLDATQWWKVADQAGCILVVICEQYSNTSVSVSHSASNTFFRQLREVMIDGYPVDPHRFYSTGQSAGSMLTQSFAMAMPDYFAAVATTSGAVAPSAGNVRIDGVDRPVTNQVVPNYLIYGYGDLGNLAGDLWDDTANTLDGWAAYHLSSGGFALGDVDPAGVRSGWQDRYETWTWTRAVDGTRVPLLKVTKNHYRSHNTMAEETPLLWDFLGHYSSEVDSGGTVRRFYSPSAFRIRNDKVAIGQ